MTGTGGQGAPHHDVHVPAQRWRVPDTLKRVVLVSVLIAVVAVVLALVIASPLALRQLGSLRGVHWPQLSDIGQTYGAASALLTGLALIGVAGSMVFQVRAIQVSRKQAIREQHAHLVEMALTDPAYQRAWGGLYDMYGSTDKYRQHGYINLILSFWQDNYVLGGFRDHELRSAGSGLFRGEAGRDFWAETREMRFASSGGHRDKRFCQILEEEYQKAIIAGPPAVKAEAPFPDPVADQQITVRNPMIKDGLTLALGIIGGIAFESFMRRKRNKILFFVSRSRRSYSPSLMAVSRATGQPIRRSRRRPRPPPTAICPRARILGRFSLRTGADGTVETVWRPCTWSLGL